MNHICDHIDDIDNVQCTEYNFVYLLISSNKKSYFNVINMYNLL